MKPLVVLLHGLWLNRSSMALLGRRLQRCGFRVRYFGYSTVRRSPQANAASLRQFLQPIDSPVIHFVAHSLGGLVLLHYFHDYSCKTPGRVVLLGTPLAGSRVARRTMALSLGRRMLGKSVEAGVLGGAPPWPGGRELGVIAGSMGLGLGLLFGGFDEPNDGTVAVQETRVPWLTDHIALQTSHTGLLVSQGVVRQVCNFLKTGSFQRDNPECEKPA